ncbi:MAG: TonB-dependent receptor, partial [Pricia sp.]
VLSKIQMNTDYEFFYLDAWFTNRTISGDYTNISLSELLESVFEPTVINFYFYGNRIILTQNSLIYDSISEQLFESHENHTLPLEHIEPEGEENQAGPVLTDQSSTNLPRAVTTVRIGKENKDSATQRFTLSGYVKNKTTGQPLSDLALLVEDSEQGTSTDEEGFYSLKLSPGEHMLATKGLGLQDTRKRIIIYNNGSLDIELEESVEQLEEVVLTGNRNQNVETAITGVTQIKVEQIKTIPLVLGERDILKVATTLPGISTAGEGASGFNVRGGKTDQNLILLDDAVIYNPSHFFGIFSALNPFTSGDVNIYKGSIPAEYGGRLSSVFDIKTKNATTKKFAGEGSIGPVTSNLALEIPVIQDKAGFLIGGRSTYSGWILRSLEDEALQNSTAAFYDVVAKYNHEINANNTLRASGYYSNDAFSITSDSIFGYSNRSLSLDWQHTFSNKTNANLILANSQYKFDIDYDGSADNDFELGYQVDETELNLKIDYSYSPKHKLNYGISSKLYQVNPGSIRPTGQNSIVNQVVIPKERALESALFLADDLTVTEKFTLNAGLRYSFYAALGASTARVYEAGQPKNESTLVETQDFGENAVITTFDGLEARISARYLLTDALSVKAAFNNTYQYIHTLSNNTTISPTDTWKLSDLNIAPQSANQFSLGLYSNFEEDTYETSLEGYFKTSQNILDFKVGAQLLLNETIETEVLQGDGKSYGIELLLKKTKGRLNGWLGYSYSRSFLRLASEFSEETVNNGEFFPSNFDKPHNLSVVANYKLTKRYSFSANFAYQTGRPVTFPIGKYSFENSEFVLYSDRNQFRIPDYYRLDVGINIEGNHKLKKLAHSFWNISVYNVLGRNNPYSVFFVSDDGQVKAFQSSIFAIPVPTITYNFKF